MYAKLFSISILIFTFKFYNICTSDHVGKTHDLLHRNKRQILFLNQSFLQFNAGITVPTAHDKVKVNYVIQAQFNLPWNTSQIPIDGSFVSTARGKRDTHPSIPKTKAYENDAGLFHFYKYIEEVLNGYGHNGTGCTLRTLCQLAAEPLHTDMEDDLFHELAIFLFTPTNDIQDGFTPQNSHIYIHAHKQGISQQDCKKLYECRLSLVDFFTYTRHDRKEEIKEVF